MKVFISPAIATPSLYLIIGGPGINDYIHEIIELDDLCQLRDNLTALLADVRLASAAPTAQLLRVAVALGALHDNTGRRLICAAPPSRWPGARQSAANSG